MTELLKSIARELKERDLGWDVQYREYKGDSAVIIFDKCPTKEWASQAYIVDFIDGELRITGPTLTSVKEIDIVNPKVDVIKKIVSWIKRHRTNGK